MLANSLDSAASSTSNLPDRDVVHGRRKCASPDEARNKLGDQTTTSAAFRLIGCLISVQRLNLLNDGAQKLEGMYTARVIGVRNELHLLLDVDVETREVVNLKTRKWKLLLYPELNMGVMVGRRIAVFWDMFLPPLEAFVLRRWGIGNRYRIVYTKSEHCEDIDLSRPNNKWMALADGVYSIHGRDIVTWSEVPPMGN